MPDGIHRKKATSPRGRRVTVAVFLSGVLVSGCGGGSASPTATGGGASSATSTGSTAPGAGASPLTFAKCMRANGVPNFPDPNAGGGVEFFLPAGNSSAAPGFKAAQAKCKRFLPNGGPPGPGSTSHASAQTLAKLLKIARCMRRHRVPGFPDPVPSIPSNPTGYREITDFDGAFLLFPSTINMQSPAYKQALTACGAPPLGLRH